jgi:hypothetical protein
MHCACGRASLEVVKLLKEKGADITAVTKDGRSMLHMAACNPDATVLQALIQWGVPPDSKKAHGQSVLHVAAWKGHLAVVEALLESASGPDMLQCVDDLGRSPLHWAVAHGHVAVVRALIAHGLDPLRRDLMGATLLHVAVLRGHTELVNTLLAQGVDPNAVDRYGSTAAELATKPEINLLLQKDHEKRKKEQLEREMDAVDQMLHSSTGISLKLSFGSFKGMTAGVTSAIEHKGVHGAVGLMKKTAMNLFTRGAAKNLRAGRMALDDSGGPTQQVASPRIEEGGDTVRFDIPGLGGFRRPAGLSCEEEEGGSPHANSDPTSPRVRKQTVRFATAEGQRLRAVPTVPVAREEHAHAAVPPHVHLFGVRHRAAGRRALRGGPDA